MSEQLFKSILEKDLAGFKIYRAHQVYTHQQVGKDTSGLETLTGFLLDENIATAYIEVYGEGMLKLKEEYVITNGTQSFSLESRLPIKLISRDAATEAIRNRVKSRMSSALHEIIFGIKK